MATNQTRKTVFIFLLIHKLSFNIIGPADGGIGFDLPMKIDSIIEFTGFTGCGTR
ncbi:hypothetical protein Back11_15450 [Paenibacillus baekrokdamisoli]|uniref:Uncharacterized protein n=1 Tax=Paenibacillus baekrokdamisoli TaxID=1712516 RepID=A0A3G9IMX6_9BACL|nr:hypothetical protein Back11_15450 [Paenibacillus baekrokdamisoli]